MELLHSDDLVLMIELEELMVYNIQERKKCMQEKGLRVNLGNTT